MLSVASIAPIHDRFYRCTSGFGSRLLRHPRPRPLKTLATGRSELAAADGQCGGGAAADGASPYSLLEALWAAFAVPGKLAVSAAETDPVFSGQLRKTPALF